MNPEEMSDEELCLAVGVEVLPHLIQGDEGCIEILSPDGREAIEQECDKRGWKVLQRQTPAVKGSNLPRYYAFIESTVYEVWEHTKYRSIAIAALKALRGGECEGD